MSLTSGVTSTGVDAQNALRKPGAVKPGSMAVLREVDAAAQAVAAQTRAAVEAKTGVTYGDTYRVDQVGVQVVAGVNYFFKIAVSATDDDYVHVRVYKDLQGQLSVNNVLTQKKAADALEYF